MIPWSLSFSFSTQRWMSGVICNSSKIERESLRVGGETCYGVCFLYSTTNKKIQEAEVDVANWKNNIMLYCIFFTLLYSFILNYFDYLLSSFFQFLFCVFFFSFWGEHFILLDRASYLFCLLEHWSHLKNNNNNNIKMYSINNIRNPWKINYVSIIQMSLKGTWLPTNHNASILSCY